MNDDIVLLTVEQAMAMLPDRDYVHTFRQAGFTMIGADWGKDEIITAMGKAKPDTLQLTGPTATAMGHGLAFEDEHGYVFVETMAKDAQG